MMPDFSQAAALAEALGLTQALLVTAGAIFVRVGAAIAVLPVLGEMMIPARVRLAAALAVTLALVGLLPPVTLPDRPSALASAFLAEVVAGLTLGLVLRFAVLALTLAGQFIAQAASLQAAFGLGGQEPMPAVAQALTLAGLTLATVAGLHVSLVAALADSYADWPMGQWPLDMAQADWATGQVTAAFGLAFRLALPFTLGGLLYNLALAAVNRAMPALMVTMIGAPAISLGVLALLAIGAPALLQAWLGGFLALAARPLAPLP